MQTKEEIHKLLMGDWEEELRDTAILVAHNSIYPHLQKIHKTQIIYPKQQDMYKAFKECQHKDLKVVILGQDPYHNPGSATGLAFQVGGGNKLNPSLKNIMLELGVTTQPDFNNWAKQGVLLLNTALTVSKGNPGSHTGIWKPFTKAVLENINESKDNIVWILWGAKALNLYKEIITNTTHKYIASSHPSPYSADKPLRNYPPFKGSDPFTKVNDLLSQNNINPIQW